IVDTIEMREVRQIKFEHGEALGKRVVDMFNKGEFDVAWLFYSNFVNVITQRPTNLRLIPAQMPQGAEPADLGGASYIYEPDEEEILKEILPRNIGVQIFRALLENAAGEQGAKMTAMDNATRNAGDMIESLTLVRNRTRQAQITKELIEIISGAEAV